MLFHSTTAWPWLAALILALLAAVVRQRRLRRRLPPGPTPLPIVGNVFNFPRTHFGCEFGAMAQKFGDVVYLNVLGQEIIVLGSLKAARDLLEKKSANYSDRPRFVMVELVGYDWLFAFQNYGARWRQSRRAMHPTMTPDAVAQYQTLKLDVARNFLRFLLQSPQDLASHIRFTITTIVLGCVYGIEVHELTDKYFQMVERVAEIAEAILIPGRFLVEAFPALRYLPSWFPGAGFKKYASDAKVDIAYNIDYLFDTAKKVVTRDPSKASVVNRILGDSKERPAELEMVCKDVAATMYTAGGDSSNATMAAFFLVMALYPEVQKRAQAELDAVVGRDRLPEFSDSPSLPYINAIVRELLRWHPAAPLGFPHRSVEDGEYNGHLIPAGVTIFVNIWDILRDPEVYPDPENFIPERFLDSAGNLDVEGRDPSDVMFGFGRRVCPGRLFAESTLFILCASVLSAFDVGPPVGPDGAPMPFKREATDANPISHPKVYPYVVKPRSSNVARLLEVRSDK